MQFVIWYIVLHPAEVHIELTRCRRLFPKGKKRHDAIGRVSATELVFLSELSRLCALLESDF